MRITNMKKIVPTFITGMVFILSACSHQAPAENFQPAYTSGSIVRHPVGIPIEYNKEAKTIHVALSDDMNILFSEHIPQIKSGSAINFIIHNQGTIKHGFIIVDHVQMQQSISEDEPLLIDKGQRSNNLIVPPGETRTLTWRFMGEGNVTFSCTYPSHHVAGMYKEVALAP